MRTAFAKTVQELAEKDKRIFIITNDLGYSVLEPFIEQFPDRYLNIGIAEQNMIGVAAGLALTGKIPVVFSIIPFATMRCYEQIRDDICYHRLNVKIVGAGSGLSYGSLGPTHHSIEDIAIMRVLPHMNVMCPADPIETELATRAMFKTNEPVYLRIHKKGDLILHTQKPHFSIGKSIVIRNGEDATLIATGNMVPTAFAVVEKLHVEGIHVRLISMHTIKPIDTQQIIESAQLNHPLFTLEEHSIIGGLGSAVSEVLTDNGLPVKLHRLGIQDRFTHEVGGQEYLRKINKLSESDIYNAIKHIVQSEKINT